MTRSARARATSHALRIAHSVPLSILTMSYDREGAFHGDAARRFTEPYADSDLLDEVHWPLAAETMNRRTWRQR